MKIRKSVLLIFIFTFSFVGVQLAKTTTRTHPRLNSEEMKKINFDKLKPMAMLKKHLLNS